jgi:uncharacterized integral membrane protein
VADDEVGEPPSDTSVAPPDAGVPSEVVASTVPSGEVTPVFRGTGVNTALVIGLVLAVLAIIVAVQNTRDVRVKFLAWEANTPLVALILAAAVAGVVLDETLGFFWRRHRRRHLADRAELRRLRRS